MSRMNPKYDHWTDSVRFNYKFVAILLEELEPPLHVTNKEAYKLYEQFCAKRNPEVDAKMEEILGYKDRSFEHMNVRNQLCKLEYKGLLIRIKPGVYRWTKDWSTSNPYDVILSAMEIQNANHTEQ